MLTPGEQPARFLHLTGWVRHSASMAPSHSGRVVELLTPSGSLSACVSIPAGYDGLFNRFERAFWTVWRNLRGRKSKREM